MTKKFFLFFLLTLFFIGCSDQESSTINTSTENSKSKNINTSNEEEETDRIVKKYGIQWDFCDCVKKNDSIDKLLKNKKLTDLELDAVLKDSEDIENKCKLFLTDLKSNKPSDRERHKEKVKACLKN